MKDENLIYVRLSAGELIQSKRDILQTEVSLLKILKTIKRYKELRAKEMETKLEILKRIRSIKREIVYIETVFPKLKIPKILKDEEEPIIHKEKVTKKTEKQRKYGDEIEEELRQIQNKLRELH